MKLGLIPATLVATLATGCTGGDGGNDVAPSLVDKALLTTYANGVVIPTYRTLAEKAATLQEASATLIAAPTDDNLAAARAAWVATRTPWEQSEGFLIGPVKANGYDPSIDSWPLNKTELDLVLTDGNALTTAFVTSLGNSQKGFHTIEFLIYGEDSNKVAAALTARESEYLQASAEHLKNVATSLATSWETGTDGNAAYINVFTTAGEAGNSVYPSLGAAGEEIVQGMIGICEEVAEGKIARPFDASDPNLVESQFSFNSLQDFSDNIRSVQNAYRGQVPGGAAPAAGTTLSEKVGARDPALDLRVKEASNAAIDAILRIPAPFPRAVTDPAAAPAIKEAQEAIRKLRDTLQNGVLPLVRG